MSTVKVKNILICIPSYTFGGAEVHSLYTAKALQKDKNVKVFFLAFGREDTFKSKLISDGFEILHFPLSNFLSLSSFDKIKTLIQLFFFLRQYHFYSIFAGTEQCNLMMGLLWKPLKSKSFFWHQWGVDKRQSMGFWEKIVSLTKPSYIANSNACKDNVIQRHRILEDNKVTIIHNTFNESLLTESRSSLSDEFKITMVANFFDEKDHLSVLSALKLFTDKYPNEKIKVEFVGRSNGGNLLIQAKAKAFDLNLYNNVEFIGLVEDIPSYLKTVNVGLLSTKSEGLSNALLEYMASGLPVIATDISQNREALGDENFFFEVGDELALMELFVLLYFSKSLVEDIGRRNKINVQNIFSNIIYENKIVSLLNE